MASVGHWQCSLQLSSSEISQQIRVTGQITSLIHEKNNLRFNLNVTHIDQNKLLFKRIIRLSWQQPLWQLAQGQEVSLLVKLKPSHGLANEGGFNYQQWLFSEGIQATGYVKASDSNLLVVKNISIRQMVLDKILQLNLTEEKWIIALTIGYRGLLEVNDWALVQKTGIAHLIAISGLHLALVASLSYFILTIIFGLLISRFFFLHKINVHTIGIFCSLFSTFMYSALAGFGLPTLRAWIMLLLFSYFFLLNKNLSSIKVLLMGISCFILLFPLSLFGASFWLSFSAVIIIWFVFWRWPVTTNGFSLTTAITSMLRIQLGLSLLMLPIVAWQFAYISFISALINLFAVPIVTLLIVPLCLLAVICLFINVAVSTFIFEIINLVLQKSIIFLQHVGNLTWAVIDISAVPIFVWGFSILALLLLLAPKLFVRKTYLVLLVMPLFSYFLSSQSEDWQINVLDVGQGVSVLLTKNERALLYDVGARYPSGFNMADSVILPILKAKGINNIDIVFISHGDNDHAGSLKVLQDKISITETITNQDSCRKGYLKKWQDLNIQVLWPENPSGFSDNNGSCVIKFSDADFSVLLTGDIDKSIEGHLVDVYGDKLKANILLAPHHGSNTSSSKEFIKMVKPEHVIFSQGFMNRWRFPRSEVVTRYSLAGPNIMQYSTSEVGQVRFTFKHGSQPLVDVLTFRTDLYPYWYANMPTCCSNGGLFSQISY